MILNKDELFHIYGGSTISGTLLNAIAKLISTLFDIGKAIGTAINMTKNQTKC
ncbi:MAG: hypothetical protein GX265_02295 [Mollicutes bacterium]|nr:hypothetical protein [Mollicutes bacterium]